MEGPDSMDPGVVDLRLELVPCGEPRPAPAVAADFPQEAELVEFLLHANAFRERLALHRWR